MNITCKRAGNLAGATLLTGMLAGGVVYATTPAHAATVAHSTAHRAPKLPSWVHWTWAPKAARADCHGGPAIIMWLNDGDQSALLCKKDSAIWPS